MKDVHSQGIVQCGHFLDKEGGISSDATLTLFDTQNFRIFEIYGVSALCTDKGS